MKFLFISVLFFQISLFGQEFIEIFQKDLPDTVLNDKSLYAEINTNINYYLKLNPQMLYYYLKYINNSLKYSLDSSNIVQLNKLINKRREFNTLRNIWLDSEITASEQFIKDDKVRSKVINFINSLRLDSSMYVHKKFETKADSNHMCYYFYKFLTGDSSQEFVVSLDYYRLMNEKIEMVKDRFNSLYNCMRYDNITCNTNNIDIIDQFPYLFKGSYIEGLNTLDFRLCEILEKYFSRKIIVDNNYFICFEFVPLYEKITINEEIQITDTSFPFYKIHGEGETKVTRFIGLGAGYKLKLNDRNTFASFVEFKLGINLGKMNSENLKYPHNKYVHIVRPGDGSKFDGYYSVSEKNNFLALYFIAEVYIPLIFITDNLSLNAGIHTSYANISYSYNFTKQTANNFNTHEATVINKARFTTNKFSLFPLIKFDYEFIAYWHISGEYLMPNYFSSSIMYDF